MIQRRVHNKTKQMQDQTQSELNQVSDTVQEPNSIFVSQKDYTDDIDGKITYTNILDTIPINSLEGPL